MDKLHLLCNAHIDPVWLWRKNEGLAEALSTFRVAADFCENYDSFVFNHNEALLYQWVEEYDPALFERIKKLVRQGKWQIMGGWYLQPDCVMTSGESLLEQIRLGREYFKEKFDVKPAVAINFDPFGHSRGLVQILTKNGYEGYIFMRPYSFVGDFIWEGFDGSSVIAHGTIDEYGTLRGEALNKVKKCLELPEKSGLCLWGIGNHGGGPSRIDLESINEFAKNSSAKIIHSSADEYIAQVDRSKLSHYDKSLVPCMVGCYTSMVRIKQANRRLENKIAATEKIMSYASMQTDFIYDADELAKAKKALAFCQFHDILPGSAIKKVEDDSLSLFGYGESIADELHTKAFFKLCENQAKAKDGEIPIMIFNPHPYEIEGEFEVDFMLQNQNWDDTTETVALVYDKDGKELPTQSEKAESSLNLDWAKKVSFKGKLAPSSVTRFDCKLKFIPTKEEKEHQGEYIEVKNQKMCVRISKTTGLIELYEVDGKVYIENSGQLQVYNDNEDSWGFVVDDFTDFADSYKLMSNEAANEFIGYSNEKGSNVRIIEDGDVRTKIQAFFEYKRSVAVVTYTIPKLSNYIDVDVLIYSTEVNKMIKYTIDTKLCGKPYGQTAFGTDEMYDDERESVYHKWCGIRQEKDALYVINKGIYGGSFTNSTIKLSLLRTPVYASLTLNDRQLVPHDRMLEHIDMGERTFAFRITTDKNIERQAQIYNEEPYVLSFFASGDGNAPNTAVSIDNHNIILSSIRKKDSGYELCLYNSANCENDAKVCINSLNQIADVHFGKYEYKIIKL